MKDIDFDELDKAVNSLMGGLKDESDAPQPKTLTISSTLKEDEKPEYSNIEEATKKIGNEAIISPVENTAVIPDSDSSEPELKTVELTSAPLVSAGPAAPVVSTSPVPATPTAAEPPGATKAPREAASVLAPPRPQTGRFMDVMHPSSTMKPASNKTADALPAQESQTPKKEASQSSKVSHFGATVEAPTIAAKDVAEDKTVPAISTPNIAAPVAAHDDIGQDETPIEEPLSSPFLPDAKDKVEKRPLGSASPVPTKEEEFDPSATSNMSSNETQLSPDPDAADALPEEFNGDLLAIETNLAETDQVLSETSVSSTDQEAQADTVDKEKSEEKIPLSRESEESSKSVKELYEEHPSVDDQPEGAIFDTSAYQQSVSHPAKSTPAWLWIVIIIVIIVVCAAGAAAFYLIGS